MDTRITAANTIEEKINQISINDFTIIKSLGKGGFGEVHMVRYNNDNRDYAMKKMLKTNKHYIKRSYSEVMREFEMMQRIKSNFIPCIKYQFEDNEAYYCVMDYCNEDLNVYLSR